MLLPSSSLLSLFPLPQAHPTPESPSPSASRPLPVHKLPQPGHLGLNPHSRSCLIRGTLPKAQAPLTIIPEDYLSLLPSECTSKTVTVLLRLNRDFSNPTLQIPTNMNPVQKSFWQPKLSPWAVPWPSLLCVSKTRLHNSTGLELISTENLRKLSGLKRLKHN